MDKVAIFLDVTRRNALRIANGLPTLNISAEYAHQVAIASQRRFRAICDGHVKEREAICQQVRTEFQAEYGVDFGNSMGGRWLIGKTTHNRFIKHMAERYGVTCDDTVAKNSITYGEAQGEGL